MEAVADQLLDFSTSRRVKAGKGLLGAPDTRAMSARALICTDDEDHSRDVMVPTGCDLSVFRLNPIVHWNHGETLKAAPDMQLPIGKSENDAGQLLVKINPHSIEATCLFSQKNRFAAQVFDLIVEKIIRGASIEWDPIEGGYEVRAPKSPFMDRPGVLFKRWTLTAWSWVGIPDNPFALAKCLSRNKLAGSAIDPALRQSLLVHAPRLKRHVTGWRMPAPLENATMAGSAEMLSILFDGTKFDSSQAEAWLKKYAFSPALVKTATGFASKQAEANGCLTEECAFQGEDGVTAICKADPPARPALVKVAPDNGNHDERLELKDNRAGVDDQDALDEDEEVDEPYGSQVLRACHAAHKSIQYACHKSLPQLEEPEVKEYVRGLHELSAEKCTEMEGLHKSKYPEMESLHKDDEGSEEGEDMGDMTAAHKSLKNFLRSNTKGAYFLIGVAEDMKKVAKLKGLGAGAKQVLKAQASRLIKVAKEAQKADGGDPTEQKLAAVEAKLSDALRKLEDAMPHRR